MALETELRFKLHLGKLLQQLHFQKDKRLNLQKMINIRQFYFTPKGTKPTIRVRSMKYAAPDNSSKDVMFYELSFKGKRVSQDSCPETNIEIDKNEFDELVEMAIYPVVEKTRYVIELTGKDIPKGMVFDVDVFDHASLNDRHVVEFERQVNSSVTHASEGGWNGLTEWLRNNKPDWIGEEITDSPGWSTRDAAKFLEGLSEKSSKTGKPKVSSGDKNEDKDDDGFPTSEPQKRVAKRKVAAWHPSLPGKEGL